MITEPPCSLFDVLATDGCHMDDMWRGEFTGPIMFRDDAGNCRLAVVEDADHDAFDVWMKQSNRQPIEEFARDMLVVILSRPMNIEDYT